jgi:hypothetical protein
VLFGALPAAALAAVVVDAVAEGVVPVEPRAYYAAAEAVLHGETPYWPVDDRGLMSGEGYVYPPLTALVTVPFTLLPEMAAGLLVIAIVVGAALAIPLVLGVRDWRCYGVLLLWPPILHGIQTGNVNMLLALAVALVWRFRASPVPSGIALGAAFAAKLLLWPLGLWLAAMRRYASVAWALAAAVLLSAVSWAAVSLDALREYPALVRRLSSLADDRAYDVYAIAVDLGAPSVVARGLWAMLGVGLVGAAVVAARRRRERSSFVLAVAASLAVTPIVWLHYFVLLLPVVALVQRRLGALWLLPLAMFVTQGGTDPGPLAEASTFILVVLAFALALRSASREESRLEGEVRIGRPVTVEAT